MQMNQNKAEILAGRLSRSLVHHPLFLITFQQLILECDRRGIIGHLAHLSVVPHLRYVDCRYRGALLGRYLPRQQSLARESAGLYLWLLLYLFCQLHRLDRLRLRRSPLAKSRRTGTASDGQRVKGLKIDE
mgnify:CR=1 FL=1|jgi:hypothetical protein